MPNGLGGCAGTWEKFHPEPAAAVAARAPQTGVIQGISISR